VCDTMVVVGEGRVLFAKNSDRDPNEAQLLDWQPRRTHPSGTRLRCTWIDIDQVAETHAVLLSRPFWMWGAEIGANEHGLVIGNEAVFTNAPSQEVGLTGMDLLRLALERAATAGEAVTVITELVARHGQGGGCGHEDRSFTYDNSYLVADHREAYVLETAGREWAVERVTGGARSISNGLTIPGFAAGRSKRVPTWASRCRNRRALTQAGAAGASGPGDLMAVLRDHGGAVPRYSPITGAMAAPCMHAGGLAAASQTTASWVAELTPQGALHWCTATAAPCTGLFKPVRVTEPLDLGPEPIDRFDARCLWWRHELLHRRVLTAPARLLPLVTPDRDETEARWLLDPPEPASAFAEADRLLTRWTNAVWSRDADDVTDTRPGWVRRYWRIRNERAGLPTRPLHDLTERAS
jgi:secernin